VLTTVVRRGEPLKDKKAPDANPVPVAVTVSPAIPVAAVLGLNPESVGAAFGVTMESVVAELGFPASGRATWTE